MTKTSLGRKKHLLLAKKIGSLMITKTKDFFTPELIGHVSTVQCTNTNTKYCCINLFSSSFHLTFCTFQYE